MPSMLLLELVLLLLLCAVALGWLARHFKFPYPIALVAGGALLGLVPKLPQFPFDPQLILVARPAAHPVSGRAADLVERFQGEHPADQPAGHRPGRRHHARGRRGAEAGGAPAFPGRPPSCSARSFRRPMRWPRRPSSRGSTSPAAWSPFSKAKAWSTMPPAWCSTSSPSPPCSPAAFRWSTRARSSSRSRVGGVAVGIALAFVFIAIHRHLGDPFIEVLTTADHPLCRLHRGGIAACLRRAGRGRGRPGARPLCAGNRLGRDAHHCPLGVEPAGLPAQQPDLHADRHADVRTWSPAWSAATRSVTWC